MCGAQDSRLKPWAVPLLLSIDEAEAHRQEKGTQLQVKPAARLLLLIASALAFALAFPPFGHSWILLGVWPAFLVAIRGLRPSFARGAGFLWGLIAFGAGVSWFWNIFEARCIPLFAILAIFPALFAGLLAWAEKKGLSGARLAGFAAVAWCALEFVRGEIFWLKFPWLTFGTSLDPFFLHPLIGTYGVGFCLTLGMSLAINGSAKTRRIAWATSLLLVIASHLPLPTPPEVNPGIRITGIQAEAVAPEEYLSLTEASAQKSDLVIWPEYSVPFDLRKSTRLFQRVAEVSSARDLTLVIGTQTDLGGGIWSNSALTLKGTEVLGQHDKVHTVHLFADGQPGKTALPVTTALGKIGTPICFDCDFQDIVRPMTSAGAEFFAVPIMDAESWGQRLHVQHAHLFRLRAAENRRWMAVVGTSGVSQIIDPQGNVITQLPAMKPGILQGTLHPRTDLTIYTRIGWLLPWALLASLPILIAGIAFRSSSNSSFS